MKRLNRIIDKINDSLAKNCYDNGEMSACVDCSTKQGYIEVELMNDDVVVTIFHNNINNERGCDNLAEYIKSKIDLENISSSIFSEQDSWQGDPGFSSEQDYIRYKYL